MKLRVIDAHCEYNAKGCRLFHRLMVAEVADREVSLRVTSTCILIDAARLGVILDKLQNYFNPCFLSQL
jgi:hypothetical protein